MRKVKLSVKPPYEAGYCYLLFTLPLLLVGWAFGRERTFKSPLLLFLTCLLLNAIESASVRTILVALWKLTFACKFVFVHVCKCTGSGWLIK